MASDIDREAEFNTTSYKDNQKRDLKKDKRRGEFLPFLTYFQKQGRLFLTFKAPP